MDLCREKMEYVYSLYCYDEKMQHYHTTGILNPPLFLANSPDLDFKL